MLRGERVVLRLVERADLPRIVSWRNQPRILRGLLSHRPISLAQQEQWFASYISKQDEMLFIIEVVENGTPIGTIGLTGIDFRNRQAEFGRLLIGEEAYLRQGYATEATLVLLDYAFSELNLHRVYLKVIADNEPAVRLYQRCHFQIEGRCRDANFFGGRFHDVLIMAILDQEYLAARESVRSYR
ncbi:MAG: GNAT family N-acetyltransferase [Anaerolineae bacterium]